jgi:hypothetical protein
MLSDPITEEIRSIRHCFAAQFANNVSRIADDIRQREASDGRTYVRLPKRPARVTPIESNDAEQLRNTSPGRR